MAHNNITQYPVIFQLKSQFFKSRIFLLWLYLINHKFLPLFLFSLRKQYFQDLIRFFLIVHPFHRPMSRICNKISFISDHISIIYQPVIIKNINIMSLNMQYYIHLHNQASHSWLHFCATCNLYYVFQIVYCIYNYPWPATE